MSWLLIILETTYRYKTAVRFGPHRLGLRPGACEVSNCDSRSIIRHDARPTHHLSPGSSLLAGRDRRDNKRDAEDEFVFHDVFG